MPPLFDYHKMIKLLGYNTREVAPFLSIGGKKVGYPSSMRDLICDMIEQELF